MSALPFFFKAFSTLASHRRETLQSSVVASCEDMDTRASNAPLLAAEAASAAGGGGGGGSRRGSDDESLTSSSSDEPRSSSSSSSSSGDDDTGIGGSADVWPPLTYHPPAPPAPPQLRVPPLGVLRAACMWTYVHSWRVAAQSNLMKFFSRSTPQTPAADTSAAASRLEVRARSL